MAHALHRTVPTFHQSSFIRCKKEQYEWQLSDRQAHVTTAAGEELTGEELTGEELTPNRPIRRKAPRSFEGFREMLTYESEPQSHEDNIESVLIS